jgi:tRNA threonylcarbamoyladenosine biosynthesis protein TsaE
MKTVHTSSPRETKKIGETIARKILVSTKKSSKKASIIALLGDLGAGKTTFAQGFLRSLGVKRKITSPTFILFRKYPIRKKNFRSVYHIDAYRLTSGDDLLLLGIREVVRDPQNIILIEWPERVSSIVPKGARKIRFSYGKKEGERNISF